MIRRRGVSHGRSLAWPHQPASGLPCRLSRGIAHRSGEASEQNLGGGDPEEIRGIPTLMGRGQRDPGTWGRASKAQPPGERHDPGSQGGAPRHAVSSDRRHHRLASLLANAAPSRGTEIHRPSGGPSNKRLDRSPALSPTRWSEEGPATSEQKHGEHENGNEERADGEHQPSFPPRSSSGPPSTHPASGTTTGTGCGCRSTAIRRNRSDPTGRRASDVEVGDRRHGRKS